MIGNNDFNYCRNCELKKKKKKKKTIFRTLGAHI
jgi:hypothetical protein